MPTLIAETKKYTVNEEMEAIDLINSYRTRAIEGEFEMASAKYTKKRKRKAKAKLSILGLLFLLK